MPRARHGRTRLLRNELEKRLANDLLDRGDGARNFRKSALGLSFAEAHADEGLKCLRTQIGNGCDDGAAVWRAVGMREMEFRGRSPRDE